MLMWQTSAINAEEVEALASHARGVAECLLRTDNKGSVILCERGKAAKGVVETRLTPLLSAGRFGPEAGPWIFLVGIWTPADWREEFCAWYQYEHGPMLLECRDWSGFQFMETSTKRGCQFHVLHRLADRAALDSQQRKRSRATPWFRRLSKNKWFDGAFERVLCHRSNLLWH
jgi:hypothetical protein